MNIEIRDLFLKLWEKYFKGSELPIVGYYSDSSNGVRVVGEPSGHSCLIAQLAMVRKGESLCFRPDSVNCGGGKRYLGFTGQIGNRFENFLSNGEDGGFCERYKRSPQLVADWIKSIPRLPVAGENLIFKRWDKLEKEDKPQFVVFFVNPDVLSGLFTLATFDNNKQDSVSSLFGAGCTSIVYYPYRAYLEKSRQAFIGLFDPSARKCVGENILSFSLSIGRMEELIGEMEESFLITPTWDFIKKRWDK